VTTALLFACGLCFFGLATAFNCLTVPTGTAALEKRSLYTIEQIDLRNVAALANFPTNFERYFNDRLASRYELISNSAFIRYRLFDLGTTSVMVGKHGWLFYKEKKAEQFIHNFPLFSDGEITYWCNLLEERRRWCAARGIRYLFYVAPISSTIYPECLPDGCKRNLKDSRLDELLRALKSQTKVQTVDLRPSLKSAKDFPIYLKTDTHWNSLGAFVATQPVLEKLKEWFPNIGSLSKKELDLVPVNYSGDLLGLVGASNKISERTLRQDPDGWRRWTAPSPCCDEGGPNYRQPFATVVDDELLPKAVCIRDSFMISQREYLSNHFSRILYGWWDDFPYEVIEREKPDVVIQEKVERMLCW
jgi:hypothetical protein